ncbi:MAG TPA: DNA-3-methyladenine glycosylase [Rubrobacteraceae bacterium]|nr:DNA-3-methyladenine glycosylase [Rubrobacteraceae bacterium]
MSPQEVLRPAFYDRDPRQVAVDLLGCILVHETPEGVASGIIVETEAYRPEDPACHAYKGPTMRNRNIFGRPGIAYVYLTYGVHKLLNAVCEGEGVGSAVLVRALRPLEGLETMRERRKRDINLCNGPGRLTQALNIELTLDGKELTEPPLYIKRGNAPEGEIIATTRIGISRGTELPWRYLVRGETDVSVPPRTITERGFERSDLVP